MSIPRFLSSLMMILICALPARGSLSTLDNAFNEIAKAKNALIQGINDKNAEIYQWAEALAKLEGFIDKTALDKRINQIIKMVQVETIAAPIADILNQKHLTVKKYSLTYRLIMSPEDLAKFYNHDRGYQPQKRLPSIWGIPCSKLTDSSSTSPKEPQNPNATFYTRHGAEIIMYQDEEAPLDVHAYPLFDTYLQTLSSPPSNSVKLNDLKWHLDQCLQVHDLLAQGSADILDHLIRMHTKLLQLANDYQITHGIEDWPNQVTLTPQQMIDRVTAVNSLFDFFFKHMHEKSIQLYGHIQVLKECSPELQKRFFQKTGIPNFDPPQETPKDMAVWQFAGPFVGLSAPQPMTLNTFTQLFPMLDFDMEELRIAFDSILQKQIIIRKILETMQPDIERDIKMKIAAFRATTQAGYNPPAPSLMPLRMPAQPSTTSSGKGAAAAADTEDFESMD